ncbi:MULTISPECIES: hypothetical protein [Methylobacterium]|uniref:hypothetical protein n=1 Tax=Methylobacterium TaxID=407 RepID=UPI001FE01493|nr:MULTISPECIES: hypothetical protein [Methylobacterium]MDR7036673.1 hypothetical protein [Methylobacterium sp. BE186]
MRTPTIVAVLFAAASAVSLSSPGIAAPAAPAAALTASSDLVTDVRMHRHMKPHRMHRRHMSRRQFQHRRMWGN